MTGVKDLTASGKITADSFTDGTATMSNGSLNGVNQINATGNIVTTGNMKAHDITAEGTIKGETINGTTGTFGSLSTTGNASVGGTLTTNGITNTGNTTTDTLAVNHNATVGGNLSVTGDITGQEPERWHRQHLRRTDYWYWTGCRSGNHKNYRRNGNGNAENHWQS